MLSSVAGLAVAASMNAGAAAAAESTPPLLGAVVITASKENILDVGGSVQFMDTADLAVFASGDPNRVLRRAPGVYIQEEDGFGLRPNIGMRGSGTDRNGRITVMEDGVLIAPAPYAAPAAYYFPRMARISGVEVSKGPAAIKYGPLTVGGALNLYSTPIPERAAGVASGEVELLGGNHGGRRAHGSVGGWIAAGGGLEVGALVEGLYERSNGFKRIDIGGDTGFEIGDFVAKLGMRTTDGRHAIELKHQRYDETSDETYLGLTLADFNASPYRRYNGSQADVMEVEHQTWQFTHRFDIAPELSLTTVAYSHKTSRAWYKLNDVRNNADTGWVGISAILANPVANPVQMADLIGAPGYSGRAGSLRVRNNNRAYTAKGIQSVLSVGFDTSGLTHTLEVSGRYHEDDEDRFQQDDRYRMVDGRMVLSTAGAPGSQENRLGEAKAWAFFVRDTIEAGALTVTPGVRYESIDLTQTSWALTDASRTGANQAERTEVDVWIPGVSAAWRLAPDVRLIAGAHRGFANPGPGANPRVETGWSYESGLRFSHAGWLAEAIGFFNDYSNLVGVCTASTGGGCDIGDQFDGGKVDVKGLEVMASRTFGDRAAGSLSVPVSLAYTFTDARFRSSFVSSYGPWGTVLAGDRLPYLARHQLNLVVGLEGERARVSTALNWVGKSRARAGQGAIPASQLVDDRLLVDVSAELDLVGGISLFASIQNLFDRTYNVAFSPAGARPGAPRLALAGVRASF